MSTPAENLKRQLELFDPDEVRRAVEKAQHRVDFEETLPTIMARYDFDKDVALLILDQASKHDVSDLAELAFAVDGIARTLVGQSNAMLLDAAEVERRIKSNEPAPSLRATLSAMHTAVGDVMKAQGGGVVPSTSA